MKPFTVPDKLLDFSLLERTLQGLADRIKDLETSNASLKDELKEQAKKSEDRDAELESMIKKETSSLSENIKKEAQIFKEELEKTAPILEEKIENSKSELTTHFEELIATKTAELTVKLNKQRTGPNSDAPIFESTAVDVTGDKSQKNQSNIDINNPESKPAKNPELLETQPSRSSKTSTPSVNSKEQFDPAQTGSENLDVIADNVETTARPSGSATTPAARLGEQAQNGTSSCDENLGQKHSATESTETTDTAASPKLPISGNQINKFRSMMCQEISRYFEAKAVDGQPEPKTEREAQVNYSIQTIQEKIVVIENKVKEEVQVPMGLIKNLKHQLYKTTGNDVFRPCRASTAPVISEEDQGNVSKMEDDKTQEQRPKSNEESSIKFGSTELLDQAEDLNEHPTVVQDDSTEANDSQSGPSGLSTIQKRVYDRKAEIDVIRKTLRGLAAQISALNKPSEKLTENPPENPNEPSWKPITEPESKQRSSRSIKSDSVLVELINLHISTLTKNIDMCTDIGSIQESISIEVEGLKRAIEEKADSGGPENDGSLPNDGKPQTNEASPDKTNNEVPSRGDMQKLQEKFVCVQETVSKLQTLMDKNLADSKLKKDEKKERANNIEADSKNKDQVNKMKHWISNNSTDIGNLRTEVLGIKTMSGKLDLENKRLIEDSNRLKDVLNQKANLRDVVELRAMVVSPAAENALLSGVCISCNRSSNISPYPGYHVSQNIAKQSPIRRNAERRKVVAGFRPNKAKELLFDHTGYPSSNRLSKSISSPTLPPISPKRSNPVHGDSLDFTQRRMDTKHSKKQNKYQRSEEE